MQIYTYNEFLSESAVRFTQNPSHAQLAIDGLHLLSQMRIWHWQVTIGDLHKALGDFYEDFSELNDSLIEAVMGKYGRFEIKGTKKYEFIDYSVEAFDSFISKWESLYTEQYRKLFSKDSEICNILDEITAEIQKIKYLATMS
jgi:hypothetical protein